MTRDQVARLLETYDLEELLEQCDVDLESLVAYGINTGFLNLPVEPVDVEEVEESGTDIYEQEIESF